jgi:hypothetical protein
MVWKGSWVSGTPYSVNEVVNYKDNNVTSSYICVIATAPGESPLSAPSKWNLVAAGGSAGEAGPPGAPGSSATTEVPNYMGHIVYGSLATGADWSQIPINGYSTVILGPNQTTNAIPFLETYINSKVPNLNYQNEVNMLAGMVRLAFKGNGTFTLPKVAGGAHIDYTNSNVGMMVAINGTIPYSTLDGTILTATCLPVGTDQFVLKSYNPKETWCVVSLFGYQTATI